MRTDDLIRALAEDAPVRWRFGRIFMIAFGIGAAIAAMAFLMAIGARADFMDAAGTVRFLFKFVVTLTVAVTSGGALSRLARPGAGLGWWRWGLVAGPLLLLLSVAAEMLAMPQATWAARLIGTHVPFCLTLIPILAIGPLACLLWALRQGAPERPGLAGALAGLAASGIAATLYAANCTDDSPFFVAAWYPLAAGIVVLAGAVAGSKLLRW